MFHVKQRREKTETMFHVKQRGILSKFANLNYQSVLHKKHLPVDKPDHKGGFFAIKTIFWIYASDSLKTISQDHSVWFQFLATQTKLKELYLKTKLSDFRLYPLSYHSLPLKIKNSVKRVLLRKNYKCSQSEDCEYCFAKLGRVYLWQTSRIWLAISG